MLFEGKYKRIIKTLLLAGGEQLRRMRNQDGWTGEEVVCFAKTIVEPAESSTISYRPFLIARAVERFKNKVNQHSKRLSFQMNPQFWSPMTSSPKTSPAGR